MSDIISRMQYLINILNKASEAYYGGQPEVLSDHEWDAMFDELTDLETKSGTVLDNSPTHKVSSAAPSGKQVRHEVAALSLPKSKLVSDVLKWKGDRPCNLSWKLDGLTLVATYDNGRLTQLATRGGGEVGDDITHLTPAISGIPSLIAYTGHLVVRGECVISYSSLAEYNSEFGTDYESPRNLASGSCNPLSTLDKVIDRPLEWKVFTLVSMNPEISSVFSSQSAGFKWLKGLGFEPVDFEYCDTDEKLEEAIKRWSDKVQAFDYPVDGLVITYEDAVYARSGSLTEHHSTTGGFALKWADEEVPSILTKIEWSPSVNSLNPVGIFDSVKIENTSVGRASLCNISELKRLGIGGPGTKVSVIKANKIIPKIVSAEKVGELVIPDKCPVCGCPTEIKVSDKGIETLVCTNDLCMGKHIKKLERFVSKYGMNIKGLSEQRLKDLMMHGYIRTVKDIMHFPERSDDLYKQLSAAEGWGDKSVENLIREIEKSKTVHFQNIIYAVGIPGCGKDAGKQLALSFGADNFAKARELFKPEELNGLLKNSLGDSKGTSAYNWIMSDENYALLQDICSLCSVGDTKRPESGTLLGVTVVITGSLHKFKNRDELQALIESAGGKVAGSVSNHTTYLINNDPLSSSSKNKKAQACGTTIITEDDFCDKYLSDIM